MMDEDRLAVRRGVLERPGAPARRTDGWWNWMPRHRIKLDSRLWRRLRGLTVAVAVAGALLGCDGTPNAPTRIAPTNHAVRVCPAIRSIRSGQPLEEVQRLLGRPGLRENGPTSTGTVWAIRMRWTWGSAADGNLVDVFVVFVARDREDTYRVAADWEIRPFGC